MKTLKIKAVIMTAKKPQERWINNTETGHCLDCDKTKALFYQFILPSGKILSSTCQDCFERYNYFAGEAA